MLLWLGKRKVIHEPVTGDFWREKNSGTARNMGGQRVDSLEGEKAKRRRDANKPNTSKHAFYVLPSVKGYPGHLGGKAASKRGCWGIEVALDCGQRTPGHFEL